MSIMICNYVNNITYFKILYEKIIKFGYLNIILSQWNEIQMFENVNVVATTTTELKSKRVLMKLRNTRQECSLTCPKCLILKMSINVFLFYTY